MGGVSREKGVLKLVYPGGSVEIHKKAITAAEVMKQNPRHCVTRPDVFKYPWIVVRPESVLSLGRVFFVVPQHTIRRLLQSYGIMSKNHSAEKLQKQQSHIGLHQNMPPKETDDVWASEVTIKVDKGLSNPRQDKRHHEDNGCQPLIEPTKIPSQRSKTINRYDNYEADCERRRVNSSDNLYAYHVAIEKKDLTTDEQKRKAGRVRQEERRKHCPVKHLPLKEIPSTNTYPSHDNRLEGTFMGERVSFAKKENPKLHKKSREVTDLKSCLKKHEISVKKNVRFEGDDDD